MSREVEQPALESVPEGKYIYGIIETAEPRSFGPMGIGGPGGNCPDIIISDLGMPDIDGYQLIEELKTLPGMSQVPAIAISGYCSDEDRKRALGVGYLALVPKPIDIDALFGLIQELNLPALSSAHK